MITFFVTANFPTLNNTHNTVLRLGQDQALQNIDHAHKMLHNNARYKVGAWSSHYIKL